MDKRYYLTLGNAPRREVTLEEFVNAEHQCGFYPKMMKASDPKYSTTCATGGFSSGMISGTIEYGLPDTKAEKVKLGPWQMLDGHGAGRVRVGGHPDNIADRYAFIEKTPRVRTAPYTEYNDHVNWTPVGYGGAGHAQCPIARAECDGALTLLGYDLAF